MKTRIRLLEKRDIEACAAIVGANYSQKYRTSSRKEIASMFSNAAITPVYWVAEAGEKIVGFAGYIQSWMDYGIYQIFWVNVDPRSQGRGIGRRLVRKLISEIRKRTASSLIQLTATDKNVIYYRTHFGFAKLLKINNAPEYLMYLRLT